MINSIFICYLSYFSCRCSSLIHILISYLIFAYMYTPEPKSFTLRLNTLLAESTYHLPTYMLGICMSSTRLDFHCLSVNRRISLSLVEAKNGFYFFYIDFVYSLVCLRSLVWLIVYVYLLCVIYDGGAVGPSDIFNCH